jgi:alkylhydroperoxidase family enzyme
VGQALDDWRTAPVSESCRQTLGFLEKLTLEPASLEKADVPENVPRQALLEAAEIAAAFNVIDRIADAMAFRVPSPEAFARQAKFTLAGGYR